ncbi:MAG: hypothetical protein QM619_15675 [Micropruina sp.]|uniref:hypothetical protein n=1 Tax=Micropruina sp. TaxID=2737536 RepID=UPI0039E3A66D
MPREPLINHVPAATRPAAPAGDQAPGEAVRSWPRWVRIGLGVAFALALIAHFCGLYLPAEPDASQWFPNSDKVLHFLGFGIPSTLAVLLTLRWLPIAVFAAHAVVSEIAQGMLLPGRDGDPMDVLADITGVLVSVAAWWWLQRPRASATASSSPTNRTPAAARRPNA